MAWNREDAPPRKLCRRLDVPGHCHFLTFSCLHRKPFLSRERTCQWLADAIVEAKKNHSFRLIAYVFMPEHAHLLIHPTAPYSISAILKSIKSPVGQKARHFVINEAPEFLQQMTVRSGGKTTINFWQAGGGYDRNIYSAEELWEKINYIHNNPVKRGLVLDAADWKWSSAADYRKVRAGPVVVDNDTLPWR
jgi:putative transposase